MYLYEGKIYLRTEIPEGMKPLWGTLEVLRQLESNGICAFATESLLIRSQIEEIAEYVGYHLFLSKTCDQRIIVDNLRDIPCIGVEETFDADELFPGEETERNL